MNSDRQDRIRNLLTRNVAEVIEKSHLERELFSGRKLRVKHGIDPTGSKIHLGRAVVLWKLKEFQELGHKIVLIIGDFTAQIGDPSDKLDKRPFLSKDQIKKNLKNYLPQVGKVLDLKKTEIRYNSEWLAKLKFREVAELAESFTAQQMIKRRNFRERWERDEEISLREFMYPLMQGYDSVAVKADVELGGTDQLFNLLSGRKIQERYGQKPQDILITRMLLGLDGRKMSTSWGNVINIVDEPSDQYGKVMSMRDESISEYLELATSLAQREVTSLAESLKSGTNPKKIKEQLALEVVKRYHGEVLAKRAAENFSKVFSKRDLRAAELPEWKVKENKLSLMDLIMSPLGPSRPLLKSKSEAQRLISQGAIQINEETKKDMRELLRVKDGDILKIGKKGFFRIKV